jgi:hypothetical protein
VIRLALAALLALPAAGQRASPGGAGMNALILGAFDQAKRDGHDGFCFAGLSVRVNQWREAQMAANDKERVERSGYYNNWMIFFAAPGKPKFSVEVNEPNGRGPDDPLFPLYHYMTRVDGDESAGRRACLDDLKTHHGTAMEAARAHGLPVSEGGMLYIELRRAGDPSEPGWERKYLRGKSYWAVYEAEGPGRAWFVDALTGKFLKTERVKGPPPRRKMIKT